MEEAPRLSLAHRRSMSASALQTAGEPAMSRTASSSQLASPMTRARPSSYMTLITETEIAPCNVFSEQKLVDMMTAIQTDLGNSEDWSVRLAALERLQAIACGDGKTFDEFVPQLRTMHELVAEQIADLRSILCKAACRTVSVLAQQMREAFAPFAELWVPVMLRLVFSSTAVMASAADHAIRIIVSSSRLGYPRLFPIFMDTFNSKKNGVLRSRCVEYVMQAIAQWETSGTDKHAADLGEFILKAVKDADAGTRAAARQCFWVLHDRHPAVADRVLNKMDSNIQKHVHAERANVNPAVFHGSATDAEESESAAASASGRQAAPQHSVSTHARPPLRHGASERLIRDRASLLPQQQAVPAALDSGVTASSGPISHARRISLCGPSRVIANTRERPSTAESSEFEPPLRSSQQLFTAARVPLHEAGRVDREPLTATRQPALANGARRVMLPKPPVPSASAAAPLPFTAQRMGVATTEELALERPVRSIREDLLRRPERISVPREIVPAFRLTEQQVQEIAALAQNPHWKQRVDALQMIKANLEKLREAAADLTPGNGDAVGNLVDVVIAQLSEPNVSVSQAAFAALELAIGAFAKETESRIANAVLKLLLRRNDAASRSREQVNSLLEQIQRTYDAEILTIALVTRIHEIPEKAKVSLCEYLLATLPESHNCLKNSSNVRTMLVRLTTCILPNSRPSTSLVKAVNKVLQLMHQAAPEVVASQLPALSMEQQAVVKAIIEPVSELRSSSSSVLPVQASFQMPAAAAPEPIAYAPPPTTSSPDENLLTSKHQHQLSPPRTAAALDVEDDWDVRQLMSARKLADFEESSSHLYHMTPREQKRIPLSQLQHLNTDSPAPAYLPNGALIFSPEPESVQSRAATAAVMQTPPTDSSDREMYAAIEQWLHLGSAQLNYRRGSNLVVKLAKSDEEHVKLFWDEHASRVVGVLLQHLDECAKARDVSNVEQIANYHSILKAVEGLVIYRHGHVEEFVEDLVLRLLQCHPVEPSIGSHALHSVFLLGQRSPSRILRILMSNLTARAIALRFPIFLSLEKVLPLANVADVLAVCPTLAPRLQASIADPSKAVRKATVSCLAVLSDLLGHRMASYIAALTPEQQKLVEIITDRVQAKKSSSPASPSSATAC